MAVGADKPLPALKFAWRQVEHRAGAEVVAPIGAPPFLALCRRDSPHALKGSAESGESGRDIICRLAHRKRRLSPPHIHPPPLVAAVIPFRNLECLWPSGAPPPITPGRSTGAPPRFSSFPLSFLGGNSCFPPMPPFGVFFIVLLACALMQAVMQGAGAPLPVWRVWHKKIAPVALRRRGRAGAHYSVNVGSNMITFL